MLWLFVVGCGMVFFVVGDGVLVIDRFDVWFGFWCVDCISESGVLDCISGGGLHF